jgi:hypothetical protein
MDAYGVYGGYRAHGTLGAFSASSTFTTFSTFSTFATPGLDSFSSSPTVKGTASSRRSMPPEEEFPCP